MSVELSEEFLRQLENLAVVTRRPVAGHLRGHHRSRRTGVGMVFTDYRPYSPGDDTRNLDWGTYMRLDRLILRLFEEEADLPIYIFVDVSKSMGVGGTDKLEFARRFAAALAYVGLINHDRVSMVAFADGVLSEMPARRGKNQMWRTLHFLEKLTPQGSTSLQNAFRKFFGARRTRGLVIVASDFLDRAGFEPAFQVMRRFGHDVFAAHIVSPEDREPTFGDDVVLVDSEDGSSLKAHLTPEMLDSYRKGFAKYCSEIEAFCRSHGWGYLRADTDAPFEQLMLRALRHEGLLR
ncbi:MAG: DUF58 domain-containing protein [Betaproteobacteria bacterium]|jgi:uncharacterized protein (DUF58 family)|nr:MAG: DUF58 domain-containing protein [Betaproteobacteria bacterium]